MKEGDDRKINNIMRCGCVEYIKTSAGLFKAPPCSFADLQKLFNKYGILQYLPMDIEQNFKNALQCLSTLAKNTYVEYIENEIRLIRADLQTFREVCTPIITPAGDGPQHPSLKMLLLQLKSQIYIAH
jgi:hypothetical protein